MGPVRKNCLHQPCFVGAFQDRRPRRYPASSHSRVLSPTIIHDFSHGCLKNAPLFSSSTQLHLFTNKALASSKPASSAFAASMGLAFLLGGIFFSKVLPPVMALLTLLWRRLVGKSYKFQDDEERNSIEHTSSSSNQARPKNNNKKKKIPVTRVERRGLVVLQHVAEQLAGRSFQTQMCRALEEGLQQVAEANQNNVRCIDIERFQTNPTPRTNPPRFWRGTIYHLSDCMVFDVDVSWHNCAVADLKVVTRRLGLEIPFQVHNLVLKGTLRLILTPLLMDPPGFGACLVSFRTMPFIDGDITVGNWSGPITEVGWIKDNLLDALRTVLKQEIVWPNRIVNPMLDVDFNATKIPTEDIEQLKTSDPFLETMETASSSKKSRIRQFFRRKEQGARETS